MPTYESLFVPFITDEDMNEVLHSYAKPPFKNKTQNYQQK